MKIKKQANALRVPALKKTIKVKRKSSDPGDASTVTKALENVKKVLQKKNEAPKKHVPAVKVIESAEDIKEKKQKRTRGIVYVGHIPHGFYEEQMKEYFSQFGTVTRVRVARSKNTGKSRGYGYIEFLHADVAKIASETMNNYLMCGRLVKAMYIPPENQHKRFFVGKTWTEDNYPKLTNRERITSERNSNITDAEHEKYVRRTLKELSTLEKKLKEKGFDLKFKPVGMREC